MNKLFIISNYFILLYLLFIGGQWAMEENDISFLEENLGTARHNSDLKADDKKKCISNFTTNYWKLIISTVCRDLQISIRHIIMLFYFFKTVSFRIHNFAVTSCRSRTIIEQWRSKTTDI